jgi:hypothetical protein
MLSERPNVRVHNDPLRMCPARESAAGGRETRGVLSWVLPFFEQAKKGNVCSVENSFCLYQGPA